MTLVRCVDGATGLRKAWLEVYDYIDETRETGFADTLRRNFQNLDARRMPYLCTRWPYSELHVRSGRVGRDIADFARLCAALGGVSCWDGVDDKLRDHCAPCWHHVLMHKLDEQGQRRARGIIASLNPEPCTAEAVCE